MDSAIDLIQTAYRGFNTRNIEAALAPLDEQVSWADGNGGTLHGKRAVREHWREQWAEADPHIDVLDIARTPDGIVASIRARMRGHDQPSELRLENVFQVERGKIIAMRIPNASS
jgi:hypothetical protein